MIAPVVDSRTRIRVLHSLAPPDGTTKYVNQITEGAADDVTVRYFSWREALSGRYDVLHLHWPELLLRGRSARIRLAKRLCMRLLLLRTRLLRIPIVRTVHNLDPHERGSRAEQRLLAAIQSRTSLFIRLNPTTELPGGAPVESILHGHYRDRFAAHPRESRRTDRVLYFGIIRPYKGVDRLLEIAPELGAAGIEVRIVGSPTPELRDEVRQRADELANVSARLAFVADAELVAEVSAADLVVLPYRELHNSGVALVALSLDRPVLVPDGPSTRALRDEVGSDWVIPYEGELGPEQVIRALDLVHRPGRSPRPALEGRDWASIGEAHSAAYRRAIEGAER
ncbi:glycosyltransferase [Naasia sp. SYSU D00948]|uniref:glycosyltransferase n=1 Tax=Naasia sp. SYSU D00948 TaxID=2817379 RepID=UPI001B310FC7|nr:glycosyltransferase [Naasia sp. SYSU D00948]